MFTSRFKAGRCGTVTLGSLVLALGLPLPAPAQTPTTGTPIGTPAPAPHLVPALTLGLDRALLLAQHYSRQIKAQDALAQSARQMAVAAGQLPDLTLKFGINNLPVTGPDQFNLTSDFMTMQSVGVMRELTRADKRQARAARFEREAEVADATRALSHINLQRDTATAWLERHYLEHVRDLLGAQRAEVALQAEAAEAAYRGGGGGGGGVGRGTQADVFAARSALAQMDDRLQQAKTHVLAAKTRLVRWVGPDGNQTLAAPPDLNTLPLNIDTLEAQLQANPHDAVMASQEAVARAEADVAQSEKKADWTMELMFNQRGPAYSNMVSINFSLPLQLNQGQRQDRELGAKLAGVEQMQAQREEAKRERLAQARAGLQQWQGNRERLLAYDRVLRPLNQQRTQAALAAYRGNSGPLVAVLEARRMEIDTRMDQLRLEMETAALWAQLNHLIAGGHEATAAATTTPASASALEK